MGSMPTAGAANVTSGGKRTHEEGASMEVKRQKVSVQPPPQERLPDQGSMDLGELQKRFQQLKEEVSRGIGAGACSKDKIACLGGNWTEGLTAVDSTTVWLYALPV